MTTKIPWGLMGAVLLSWVRLSVCLTSLEISSCGHLLTYLQSCSQAVSLSVSRDIACKDEDIPTVPVLISQDCVIHGQTGHKLKAPTIDWGASQKAVHLREGATLTLENIHIKFAHPGHSANEGSIAPSFLLGNQSKLVMNSVIASFDTCMSRGTRIHKPLLDLLSWWLNMAGMGKGGSFYFAEEMTIMHSNGSFSSLCGVGVHCGIHGEDPSVLESFIKSISSDLNGPTCNSTHANDKSSSDGKTAGIWIIVGLVIAVVLLSALLMLVRKELSERTVKAVEQFPDSHLPHFLPTTLQTVANGSDIQEVYANILDDSLSKFVVHGDKRDTDNQAQNVHTNPLFSRQGEVQSSSALQADHAAIFQGLPETNDSLKDLRTGLGSKAHNILGFEQVCHHYEHGLVPTVPAELWKGFPSGRLLINMHLRNALQERGAVMYGSDIIFHSCSTLIVKGFFAGETVAIKILEQGPEESSSSCLGALLQSRCKHYNLVRVLFVVQGNLEGCQHLPARGHHDQDVETEPENPQRSSSLVVQSVIINEYCDMGTLKRAINDMLFGCWEMPRMSWILMTGIDIAEAMACLHKMGIVHGNLCSENISIASDMNDPRRFVCKVDNLYRDCTLNTPVLASECISAGKSQDVFAFGNVMLELTSSRRHPLCLLKSLSYPNGTPMIPASAPPFYVQLLQHCWDPAPEKRPSFDNISKTLKGILIESYICESTPQATGTSTEGGLPWECSQAYINAGGTDIPSAVEAWSLPCQ